MSKRAVLSVLLMIQLAMWAGCSSPEPKDLSGQTLAPVPVDQVKLYQQKPLEYDNVGLITIEITPDMKWDEYGTADKAFDAFRAKAAAMGANGVLFQVDDKSKYDALVGAYYHNRDNSYQVPINRVDDKKYGVAEAILVHKE